MEWSTSLIIKRNTNQNYTEVKHQLELAIIKNLQIINL